MQLIRHLVTIFIAAACAGQVLAADEGRYTIDLDEIFARAPLLLSPAEQVEFREYWAGQIGDYAEQTSLHVVAEYLGPGPLAELRSGSMPMTDDGVVALGPGGQSGWYVAVFDTNVMNAPRVPVYSSNGEVVIENVQLRAVAPGMYLGRFAPGQYAYRDHYFSAIYVDGNAGKRHNGRTARIKEALRLVSRF